MELPISPLRRQRGALCALATLTVLAATAPAQAQDLTHAWIDLPSVAAGTGELHYSTTPLEDPAGPPAGALIVTGIVDGSLGLDPTDIRFTRLSANGDDLWQIDEPVDARPFGTSISPARVVSHTAPDGESVVAVQSDQDVELVRIAADGTLRWRATLEPSIATDSLLPNSLHVTDSGDVIVGAWQSDGMSFLTGTEVCTAVRFDVTGTLIWRVELPAPFWSLVCVASNGNVLAALMNGSADAELRALDPAGGQQLWQASIPGLLFLDAFHSDHSGGARVAGLIAGSSDSKVVAVDAIGAVTWEKTIAGLSSITSAAIPASDATFVLGVSGKIVSLDAAGLSNWEITKPPGPYSWTQITADAAGTAHVARVEPIAGQPGLQPSIESFDSTGQPLGVIQLPHRGPHRPSSESITSNVFGDVYFSGEVSSSSSIRRRVDTVRRGQFGSSYCTQTFANSAGGTADLMLIGSPALAVNHASFVATGLPPSQTVLFLASLDQGMTPNPAGSQGTLCVGGQIGRYFELEELRFASPEGRVSLAIDLQEMPTPALRRPAVVGEIWRFQAWYRDVNPNGTSNFTDAVEFVVQ